MAAGVLCVEVVAFEVVVDCVLVFFGYVENEGSQALVVVVAVLSADGGSADGYDDAGCCFADFYGGSVDGGDGCFLVSW